MFKLLQLIKLQSNYNQIIIKLQSNYNQITIKLQSNYNQITITRETAQSAAHGDDVDVLFAYLLDAAGALYGVCILTLRLCRCMWWCVYTYIVMLLIRLSAAVVAAATLGQGLGVGGWGLGVGGWEFEVKGLVIEGKGQGFVLEEGPPRAPKP